jgi:hypothetical protein
LREARSPLQGVTEFRYHHQPELTHDFLGRTRHGAEVGVADKDDASRLRVFAGEVLELRFDYCDVAHFFGGGRVVVVSYRLHNTTIHHLEKKELFSLFSFLMLSPMFMRVNARGVSPVATGKARE